LESACSGNSPLDFWTMRLISSSVSGVLAAADNSLSRRTTSSDGDLSGNRRRPIQSSSSSSRSLGNITNPTDTFCQAEILCEKGSDPREFKGVRPLFAQALKSPTHNKLGKLVSSFLHLCPDCIQRSFSVNPNGAGRQAQFLGKGGTGNHRV